jgi:hypothetical protein
MAMAVRSMQRAQDLFGGKWLALLLELQFDRLDCIVQFGDVVKKGLYPDPEFNASRKAARRISPLWPLAHIQGSSAGAIGTMSAAR